MRLLAWAFSILALVVGTVFPVVMAVRGGEFLSIPRLVLFGLVPICVAAVAFVAILKGDVTRKLFLAYGLALMVAFYGVEIYLSIQAEFHAPPVSPPDNPNIPAGTRIYPQLCGAHLDLRNPPIHIDDKPVQPVSGLANNLLNPAADRSAWRFTDQYGFNNPPDQWKAGSPMVVGDSFAFGEDVPIGQGFVDRMRERLGPVVNLGCDSNGPLIELASLIEYGPLLRPHVVVWTYSEGTDLISDISRELRSPILPRYLSPGFKQDLAINREPLERSILAYLDRWMRDASARDQAARNVTTTQRVITSVFEKDNLFLRRLCMSLGLVHHIVPRMVGTFEQVLRRAKTVVSEWDGHLVFVYLPDKSRYATVFGEWDAAPYGQQVIEVAQRLGLDVIDINPVFRKRPNPAALYARHWHYSLEGYALVGDTIADALIHSR